MTSSTIIKVQKNLDKIIASLLPHYEFFSIQMVPWLCENFWEKFVPEAIRNEIKCKEDVKTAMELFFKQNAPPEELIKKHSALFKHIEHQKTFYLENLEDKLYLTENELLDEFKRLQIPIQTGLSFDIKDYMGGEKKSHEVEVASSIVGTLARARDKEHFVLDVGDGKGYLSSRLAIEFGLKVLGVDGNVSNSLEALIRNEKLSKNWKHLVNNQAKKKNIESLEEVVEKFGQPDLTRYRTASAMIYGDTNLIEIIEREYPDEDIGDICIAGLHTCGNLGANTLKQFVNNDRIKIVMSIPCCHNLIHEEFTRDYFNGVERINDKPGDFGFPLSNYLREKKFYLGRNTRMLGTQCLEKILEGKLLPDETLFYRAIFEKLLRERWRKNLPVQLFRLGKIKRVNSLEEYLIKGCKRMKIEMDLTSEEIAEIERVHELDRELIDLHYFLRVLYSKPIEALINLDRYLYLLERNIKHVYLVKIFDPTISPRHLAVIGIKD